MQMFVDFGTAQPPLTGEALRLHRAYYLEADETYQVHHAPLPKGTLLLLMVIDGSGYFSGKNVTETVYPGEVMMIDPQEQPFYYRTQDQNWSFWWFEFDGYAHCQWRGKRSMRWDTLLSMLCEAVLIALKQGHGREASTLFSGLVSQVLLRCGEKKPDAWQEERFFQAQQIIQRELGSITVSGLAERLGLSVRTLRDLFQKFGGCGTKQYILNVKLETACYLLENTSKNLDEIADILGFSSQFHFSRTFHQSRGMSPRVWRSRHSFSQMTSPVVGEYMPE